MTINRKEIARISVKKKALKIDELGDKVKFAVDAYKKLGDVVNADKHLQEARRLGYKPQKKAEGLSLQPSACHIYGWVNKNA